MNINSTAQPTTSFKGIQSEVMNNFGKFGTGLRTEIARHYKTLENSEAVDLVMIGDKVGLEIKKPINEVIGSLKLGDKLTFENVKDLIQEGTGFKCLDVIVNGKKRDLYLNCGFQDIAKTLFKWVEGDKVPYEDSAPAIGVLLDSCYKMEEPITKIKEVLHNILV